MGGLTAARLQKTGAGAVRLELGVAVGVGACGAGNESHAFNPSPEPVWTSGQQHVERIYDLVFISSFNTLLGDFRTEGEERK